MLPKSHYNLFHTAMKRHVSLRLKYSEATFFRSFLRSFGTLGKNQSLLTAPLLPSCARNGGYALGTCVQRRNHTVAPTNGSFTEQGPISSESNKEFMDPKETILQHALAFVPTHGWTEEALAAGAQAAGFPSAAHGMFSRGAYDLIDHVMHSANLHVANHLATLRDDGRLHEMPVNLRIREGLITRIQYLSQFRESWGEAMAQGILPHNVQYTAHSLAVLADEIWHIAGDQSVDLNWYTRRGFLVAVCIASELHMLTDTSPKLRDTWSFIERRLDDVSLVGQSAGSIWSVGAAGATGLQSILEAGLSIFGPLVASSSSNPILSVLKLFDQVLRQVQTVQTPFEKDTDVSETSTDRQDPSATHFASGFTDSFNHDMAFGQRPPFGHNTTTGQDTTVEHSTASEQYPTLRKHNV